MKKLVTTIACSFIITSVLAQGNVGVNTVNPQATFHVDAKKNNPSSGTIPASLSLDDMVFTKEGRIGIGTTTPEAKMHVVMDNLPAGYGNDLFWDRIDNSRDWSPLQFRCARGNVLNLQNLQMDDGLGGIVQMGYVNGIWTNLGELTGIYKGNGTNILSNLRLSNHSALIMLNEDGIVDFEGNSIGAGNVRIRTTGIIKAQSFVSNVQTYPDYVFQKYYNGQSVLNPSYKFMSLQSVEKFIKENGHLPGYKSAAEIEEEGHVDITQNTITNLEKIEELYLHLIEQSKKIENLEKEVKRLEGQLKNK